MDLRVILTLQVLYEITLLILPHKAAREQALFLPARKAQNSSYHAEVHSNSSIIQAFSFCCASEINSFNTLIATESNPTLTPGVSKNNPQMDSK